ncbi:mechanosensitive ion channel family protein [Pontibacter harenae]|uniref:mechanosensitive ion channel family protein n=1 Tax=Pontibacter harenae TaxID=2894083 RepID=UPI001E64ED86|nr:mechanosensitive ion channel domain-containing protein [Pontibacter harenae]MCC9166282.1 mechanosensitive ion channel family protein [Pontibacter harenae]
MERLNALFNNLDYLAIGTLIISLAAVIGWLVKLIIFKLLNLYNRHSNPHFLKSVVKHLNGPFTAFLPMLFATISLQLTPFTEHQLESFRRIFELVNIAVFGWILIKIIYVAQDMVQQKFEITKEDNFRERKVITQLSFIRKLAITIITFVTVALILLTFEPVRKLGTGLLTSAGIAGIVVGLAAQQSIANLLAGLQLAFTQPLRIDDVLVVEGEWGRVEEVTLTYVVLRIWDNRRLILPLKYFIEKPFQNWTRTAADLLGTVFLYTDYTVPIEELRKELDRILAGTKLWDGRVSLIQVTDSLEQTLQLRILLSAQNSAIAFDLRCLVREKMITFIQQNYPSALPRTRTELVGESFSKFMK